MIAMAVLAVALPSSAAYAEPGSAGGARVSVSYEDAVPGLAPPGAADNAVYLDRAGRRISEWGPGEARPAPAGPTALGCTPESGRDNPHYSSGDVSGRGWWKKGSCTASTAHVFNCLYERYTDSTWRQPDGCAGDVCSHRRDHLLAQSRRR